MEMRFDWNNGLVNVEICFQFYLVTVAIVHSPFLTIILPQPGVLDPQIN